MISLLTLPYASLSANERRRVFLYLAAHLEIFAEMRGFGLLCFTFWRDPKAQLEAKAAGQSKLTRGYHQLWQAKDYVLLNDAGKARWEFDPDDPADPYDVLGQAWERMHPATVWGGRWQDPIDPYHFQFGGSVHPERVRSLPAGTVFPKLLAGQLPALADTR